VGEKVGVEKHRIRELSGRVIGISAEAIKPMQQNGCGFLMKKNGTFINLSVPERPD
jgi:hypothetical protein